MGDRCTEEMAAVSSICRRLSVSGAYLLRTDACSKSTVIHCGLVAASNEEATRQQRLISEGSIRTT
jgi:hypothetical protein